MLDGRRRAARLLPVVAALAIGALGTAGCRPGARPARPLNILLISIDALRADRLQAYGYPRPTSPFLEQLGQRGLVFENAFVNTHGTTPSHATILSGLHQETHGVGLDGGAPVTAPVPDSIAMVQELLRAHGYTTLGVTDGGNAGEAFGFARGFDRFDDRGGGIAKVGDRVAGMIEEAGREAPLFVFLHTYEAHSPYKPAPEQRALLGVPDDAPAAATSRFLLEHAWSATTTLTAAELDTISRLYDAEIRGVDDGLRELFGKLEALGFLDHAVVLITADHGEEFGDHGGLLHRELLYDELIKVPLLLLGPGIEPGRRREPVSSVDIAPTLLELAGAPRPAAMEGSSLLSAHRRGGVVSQYGRSRYSLRTLEWKLIWTAPGSVELYRMDSDPRERENVADRHPEERAALEGALDRWRKRHRDGAPAGEPAELTPDQWRELEALGYLR
jgi:arylsulfatase A-like enzyme